MSRGVNNMKLSPRFAIVLFAALGLVLVAITDRILPGTTEHQQELQIWLAARATGVAGLVLLAVMVVLGILMSHPEQTRWKAAKTIYPWHETLWVFVLAFMVVHAVSLALDPFAEVGLGGMLVPGLSTYRPIPVAIGVVALYAALITGLTARFTKLLPTGWWLKLHRFALVVLALAWTHGVLAGTDTLAFAPFYWGIAAAVAVAGAHRFWIMRPRVVRKTTHALVPAPEDTHEPSVRTP